MLAYTNNFSFLIFSYFFFSWILTILSDKYYHRLGVFGFGLEALESASGYIYGSVGFRFWLG